RSVAPLTTLSAQRADPVVTFEPALHGTGEWLNTSIYRFLPSDLAPATTYHLKVAKGLTSAADGVLQQDWTSAFTTITPAVDLIQPDTNWIYTGPWQQVDVTFNQPMDPSAAAGFSIVNAETGTAAPGTLKWNDAHTLLSVNPTERLAAETSYTVDFLPGATDRYGQAMGGYRFSFTTGPVTPSVSLALPGYNSAALYSSSAEPILYYQTTNMPSVEFTLFPLTADEGRRLL